MRKSILDPSFRYVSSVDTNISKTFARVRKEQKAAAAARTAEQAQREADTARVVTIMETRRIAQANDDRR